jgi:hypothetical protein
VIERAIGHTQFSADVLDRHLLIALGIDVALCYIEDFVALRREFFFIDGTCHDGYLLINRDLSIFRVYPMAQLLSIVFTHLHWQLIPRLPEEMIGGRFFASARGVLTNYAGIRDALLPRYSVGLPARGNRRVDQ